MILKRISKVPVPAALLAVIMLFANGCSFLPESPDAGDSEAQSSSAPAEITRRSAASTTQIEEINDYLTYLYNATNNALAKEKKYLASPLTNFLNSTDNEKGFDESLFLNSAENLRGTWQKVIDEYSLSDRLVSYEVFAANPFAYQVASASETERMNESTSANLSTSKAASVNPPTSAETAAAPTTAAEPEDCPKCYGLKVCTVCNSASLVYGKLGFVCGVCYNSHVCATCNGSGKKGIQGSGGGGGGYIQPPNNSGGGGNNNVDPGPKTCGVCKGMKLCVTCNGLGYPNVWLSNDPRPPCSACNGNKRCWSCNGTGVK